MGKDYKMKIIPMLDERNGCSSYIIGDEFRGSGVVIDPLRTIGYQKYIITASQNGVSIKEVIESHVHADHYSASKELARALGIKPSLSKVAPAKFEFNPLRDGDTFDMGFVKIRVMDTPGHTPDSVSLIVSDESRSKAPWCVFTGDSLFVGDIGRPDLVFSAEEDIRQASFDQYNSIFEKLLELPDFVEIYPAHSGSSACGGIFLSHKFSSTIGFEKKFNIFTTEKNKLEFSKKLLRNMKLQPENANEIRDWNLSPELYDFPLEA